MFVEFVLVFFFSLLGLGLIYIAFTAALNRLFKHRR